MEILTEFYIPMVCFMVASAILKDNKTVVDKEMDINDLRIPVFDCHYTHTKLTGGKLKSVAKKTH